MSLIGVEERVGLQVYYCFDFIKLASRTCFYLQALKEHTFFGEQKQAPDYLDRSINCIHGSVWIFVHSIKPFYPQSSYILTVIITQQTC